MSAPTLKEVLAEYDADINITLTSLQATEGNVTHQLSLVVLLLLTSFARAFNKATLIQLFRESDEEFGLYWSDGQADGVERAIGWMQHGGHGQVQIRLRGKVMRAHLIKKFIAELGDDFKDFALTDDTAQSVLDGLEEGGLWWELEY